MEETPNRAVLVQCLQASTVLELGPKAFPYGKSDKDNQFAWA
jgi:hypothetical protein